MRAHSRRMAGCTSFFTRIPAKLLSAFFRDGACLRALYCGTVHRALSPVRVSASRRPLLFPGTGSSVGFILKVYLIPSVKSTPSNMKEIIVLPARNVGDKLNTRTLLIVLEYLKARAFHNRTVIREFA